MRRPIRLMLAAAALGAALFAACGGERGPSTGPMVTSPAPMAGNMGTVAFVDGNGCVTRVEAASGRAVAAPYCTNSRAGVTTLTWIDANTLAYATAESRALGWQLVDFRTGQVRVMDMVEAPRVFLIPPQFYSPRGEQVEVDDAGVVTRETAEGSVRIFPPESQAPDRTTRLVAWSPDADRVLLSTTTNKALWIVGRSGESPRQIAAASRGVASWFVPGLGVTPHADLTCSVITAGSYTCLPGVRAPLDGASFDSRTAATLDFAWSPCPGATGYEVQLFAGESIRPVAETVTAGTFWHIPAGELPPGEVRWRIRAHIGPSPAPWSEEMSVTVR